MNVRGGKRTSCISNSVKIIIALHLNSRFSLPFFFLLNEDETCWEFCRPSGRPSFVNVYVVMTTSLAFLRLQLSSPVRVGVFALNTFFHSH